MKAHDLAEILLNGNNYPVVIRSKKTGANAETIKDIFILQHCDSPFEYAILLDGQKSFNNDELIDLNSI